MQLVGLVASRRPCVEIQSLVTHDHTLDVPEYLEMKVEDRHAARAGRMRKAQSRQCAGARLANVNRSIVHKVALPVTIKLCQDERRLKRRCYQRPD